MTPTLSALGERLRERTAPLAPTDAAHGWVHAHLCEAIMVMAAEVGAIYDPPDPTPPTAPLLDPALCPDWALPWLAQLTGATIPPSATPEQARTLITSVAGWKRGTPAAIRAAVMPLLTGTQTVYFRERDGGDPYALEVVALTSEVPPSDLGQPVNLVTNPSFELGTTGWGPYGAGTVTLERRADCAYAGGYGVRVTRTAGIPNNAGITIPNPQSPPPPPPVTLTAPRLYNWSAWMRGRAGSVGTLFMDWQRNGAYESAGLNFLFTGTWQRMQLPVTIPAGLFEWTNVYAWASMSVGDSFDIDAAMFVDGHALPDYFDGSTPGYEWTGAAHAATSKPVTTHQVERALQAAKPGGLILNYRTVASWDYEQMTTAEGAAKYSGLKAKYPTYTHLREHRTS